MRLQRCQTGAVMSIAKFRRFSNRVQVKPVGDNSEERGFSMQFMKMAVWEFSQHFCDYPSTTRDEMKTPTEFPCTLSNRAFKFQCFSRSGTGRLRAAFPQDPHLRGLARPPQSRPLNPQAT